MNRHLNNSLKINLVALTLMLLGSMTAAHFTGFGAKAAEFTSALAGWMNGASAGSLYSVSTTTDLSITKTNGTGSVIAGGITTYTITVSNNGTSVTGAILKDPAVANLTKTVVGCSMTPTQCVSPPSQNPPSTVPSVAQLESAGGYPLPTLASGQTYQITVSAKVADGVTGTVTNTATVDPPAGVIDSNTNNNSASDTDNVTRVTDLVIAKDDGSLTYTPGSSISYMIKVTNGGPSASTGASVADTVPAAITSVTTFCSASGSASCGTNNSSGNNVSFTGVNISPGSANFITITVSGTVSPATTGYLVNTATVAVGGGQNDPNPGNNSATDTDTPVGGTPGMIGCATPSFSGTTDIAVGTNPKSVAVADFNLDGNLDIVSANIYSHNVSVMLGNGAGGFGGATNFLTGPVADKPSPVSVAVADFNRDGKPDIVAANGGQNYVTVLLNTTSPGAGTPSFGSYIHLGVGAHQIAITVGDFNADGNPDIAVTDSVYGPPVSNYVTIMLGNGAGSFYSPTNFATGKAPVSVAVGDINGDGKLDIVTANSGDNNVSVLLGNGAGSLGAPTNFGVGNSPSSVAVEDVNMDGKPDIVTANAGDNNISVLINTTAIGAGTPTFGAASNLVTGTTTNSVVVADFSGDGKPDIATTNAGDDNISVLLGDGLGHFGAKAQFPVGDTPGSMAVGDFNRDGKPDLAVAIQTDNDVSVLLDTCNGTPCSGTSFAPKADFSVGTNPFSVAVGDFNLDGKPDMATANYTDNNVSVRLGTGTGGFGGVTNFGVGTNPRSVAVGDFNLDGKPDLVVANQGSNNVSVLLGNGAGSFGAKTDYALTSALFPAAGNFPLSVVVGDFNRDGKPDIATANYSSSTVSVLLGNGAGVFTLVGGVFIGQPIGVGLNPYSLAVGDFNRDGKPDLITANINSNDVSVLLGDGTGGFSRTDISVGGASTNPISVVVGDFNRDGKSDIATANYGSNNVSVLLGNGAGGFGGISNFGVGSLPFSIALGDFNIDGKPDLVVANNNSTTVSVLPGNGAGGFGTKLDFTTGTGPVFVAVGDFNLDGKPDLVSANNNVAGVSVLLSNCSAITGPTFTKTFSPTTIALNTNSTLTFSITNNSGSSSLTGTGFTDTLETGIVVATPNGLTGSCGGGTITATAGSSAISLSGATLGSGVTCTFSVNVKGTIEGVRKNTTTLSTNELGSASATTGTPKLTIFAPPTITKSFVASPILVGQTTTLNISLTNRITNPGNLIGVSFTDTLPSGISAANATFLACGGTVLINNNVVTLTGGNLNIVSPPPPPANPPLPTPYSCTIPITVRGAVASASAWTNTISSVSSTNGGTDNTPATAQITVNKASTSTTVVFDTPDPSLVNQAYTVAASVSVIAPGTATPTAPTGTITVSDGTGGSCVISLPASPPLTCLLTSTTVGIKNLTATYSGDGNFNGSVSPSKPHTVINLPTISKMFGAMTMPLNGSTSLTFTLTNPNPSTDLTGVAFSDSMPAGLVVANPSGLSSSCGGTVTANPGTGTVDLSGGTILAASNCTISLNVTGTTPGVKNNTTGAISSNESGVGLGSNTATVTVYPAPTITKAFGATNIPLNGTTSLTFSINNPSTITATGIAFSDTLPAGLVVATPNNVMGVCGGIVTAVPATNIISLSGGTLGAGGNCTIKVDVTGTTGGLKTNITGPVSSTEGGTGGPSNTATLTVVPPPTIAKAFGTALISLSGTTSLTFTISNQSSTVALNGVAFSDTLPAGLVVATPNGLNNTCGGSVTATAGSGTVSLSAGSIAAGGSCLLAVNVTGTTLGVKNNTTGQVSSTEGGTGAVSNTATVTVVSAPTITKAFSAASIPLNGTTTLTFTLNNPSSTVAQVGVAFFDSLPAGLVVATPNGLSGVCGGSVDAVSGTNSITLSGGTLGAGASCTIMVNVTGTTAGVKTNTTGPISSTNVGTGGPSNTVSVTVVPPPTIAKAFGAANIPLNGTTSLTFTLNNPSATVIQNAVAFSDTLPAGLVVATPNGLNNTCSGSATATAGSGTVTLTGGSIAANGSCTITLNVKGTTAGVKNNTTGIISSTEGGTGATSNTATVTVVPPVTIAKSFGAATVPLNGTVGMTFTINNPSATLSQNGVAFSDTMPAGLLVATPNNLTNTCGGTATAAPGTGMISLSAGTIAPGFTCTISVTVTGTTSGVKNNTTGTISSTEGGTGATSNTATVTVVPALTITKAFGTANIPLNGTTSLTFTLNNSSPTVAHNGVAFADVLPAGLVVATPNGLTGVCGGSVTATSGTNIISLSGGTIGAGGNCTIVVNVTGTSGGVKNNTTEAISSNEGGTGTTSNTATVTVVPPPTIAKAFGAANIAFNGTTSLTFTLTNPSATVTQNAVAFTDNFPAGLVVATPNGLNNTCNGSVTATAGSGTVTLTGGSLAAGGSCTIAVNVTGTTEGVKNNTTLPISSTEGGTGTTSNTATVTVEPQCPTITVNPAVLPDATTGTPYSMTLTQTGGNGTITWSVSVGALPANLTLNPATGGLSGTPASNQNGTSFFTVRATDANGCFGERAYALVIAVPTGFEADVAPRPNGSGTLTVADWVQVGRFSVGQDTSALGSEFQRADCAPRTTLGDGKITVADWVQAGRYSVGIDPPTPLGGPSAPTIMPSIGGQFNLTGSTEGRVVRAMNSGFTRGRIGTMQVEFNALGNENAMAFTLSYDPRVAVFIDAIPAESSNEATVVFNANQASTGRVAIAMAMPIGKTFTAGTHNLLTLRFIPTGGEGRSSMEVRFDDSVISRELVNPDAVILAPPQYISSQIVIDGSSAAIVSAASYENAIVAVESIATVFGRDLAIRTESAKSDLLPVMLAGSKVTVRDSAGIDREASLFYVSPGQINFQIPKESATGPALVTISNATGTVSTGLIDIVDIAPGLFITDDGMVAANQIRGSDDQVYLALFGTGWRNLKDQNNIKVLINGVEAGVLYVGAQGIFTGLDQINILLPPDLAGKGDVRIEVLINGIPANSGHFLLR